MMNQPELLRGLLRDLDQITDHEVHEIIAGDCGHLVAVDSARMGIASWALHHPVPARELPLPGAAKSAKDLAQSLLSEDPMEATLGLACLNSMLPPPPLQKLRAIKAQDLILRYGRGKNVAVIGHFPFVAKLGGEFNQFSVLEKSPRPGDLHAEQAPNVLPSADLVAISATTLANGTLAEILAWCSPSAMKILLGPSTPLTPTLFVYGINILAGCLVENRGLVKQGILTGRSFKQLQGIRHVVWEM
ncbi:MAG: hypothetical protein COT06_04210 [Syntrophobacteraceae bacterium CG07_land_8_20_14_0_80_61_8]|nr:MAG: hypothetical protein COT06_04210 [Syntrophobacteraceae bacterium CG07_land_8_20_14_0_80_61_8]